MSPGRGRDQRGSATVLVIVLIATLVVAALGATAAGEVLVGRRRAASAADLAVLAGAQALSSGATAAGPTAFPSAPAPAPAAAPATGTPISGSGSGAACREAWRVSTANGARLTDCEVQGTVVAVAVLVDVPIVFGRSLGVPGKARAGPAAADGTAPLGEGPRW